MFALPMRGDIQRTDDCRMLVHRVVCGKRLLCAHFFETRERCSGMRSRAQNLSVRLRKSLVFSRPEYDLPDTHSCEGARPAASGGSVGKHFRAPQMNGENGARSCASLAWSRKQLPSHLGSRREKTKGISTLFSVFTFHVPSPIAFPPPSSVARYMAAGLGVRPVGQYKTSSHAQEILAVRSSISIYHSAVPYFSGSSSRASWSWNPLSCATSGELAVLETHQPEVYRPTESPFLLKAPAGNGDGCMKDTDHPVSHPRSHLGDRPSVGRTRASAWCGDQFGRGQNTVLGWSDPTFWPVPVPKVIRGVAPALSQPARRVLPAYRSRNKHFVVQAVMHLE